MINSCLLLDVTDTSQHIWVRSTFSDTLHSPFVRETLAYSVSEMFIGLFEEKLAKNIREDRKSFFTFARSKSKSKVSTGSLQNSHGELENDYKVKVELLNDFFSSVFTREDNVAVPTLNMLTEEKRTGGR